MEEQSVQPIDNKQYEHQENNKKNVESNPVDVEKWEFALSVLKEAIAKAGIKDISEYDGEHDHLRWVIYSQESDKDVILKMLIKGTFGWLNADYSLIMTARWIIDEVETVLTQPDATRILDFADEERPEVLRDNARMILTGYICQIPIVAFQIQSQSLNDAIQAHIKNYVEPLLKEHWQTLGLSKTFTVTPSEIFTNHLKSIDEQFNAIRESFLGNKKARLTTEARANMDVEHEQFRSDYQVAKEYYNQSRKAFFAGKRNRTENEWAEEWSAQSSRTFPALHYRCLAEINDYPPFELAYIHLANYYGISAGYVRKLVTQASQLKSSKQ